jgi:hypothetical protein
MLLADRPTTSRWTPPRGRTLLSGQADPRRQEPRPTLRRQDTLAGVNRIRSQASVQPSTLREPSPARAPKIQHRDRFHSPAASRRAIAMATLRSSRFRLSAAARSIGSARDTATLFSPGPSAMASGTNQRHGLNKQATVSSRTGGSKTATFEHLQFGGHDARTGPLR